MMSSMPSMSSMRRIVLPVVAGCLLLLAALPALAASLDSPTAAPEPGRMTWVRIMNGNAPELPTSMGLAEARWELQQSRMAASMEVLSPGAGAAMSVDPTGVRLVERSYFDDQAVLLTQNDAATGAQQTKVINDSDLEGNYVPPEGEKAPPAASRPDPWEGFNRAMFQFNDRMYFWVLKPAAQGYSILVPEPARIGIANVFDNIRFPIRFVNDLFQAKFENSFRELLRFLVNTVFGLGGLVNSSRDHAYLNPPRQDLGKTFKTWGIDSGPFVIWPVFGPYTVRSSFGDIGDSFLWPPTYIKPWYWPVIIWTGEKVNEQSLRMGDYEALKAASLDPYVAVRDLYLQYRDRPDYDPYYDSPDKKPPEPAYTPLNLQNK
ncbi:VacJ family lipoprotein [Desulfovibrio sp. X2]|uniref:MlaA family lipoprotein n=1 Tax=Desulfovibrio sp. X2 TaxID=941449 RepID=UPI000358A825|nr:VacJ family lipoprotein [Desulfovibrio sp. X2]EPR44756.1 VacJ family lipoprotein [Desulfovibrio sp. X2]